MYWSVISECIVEESSPGYYFEKHRMHVDLNKLAGSVIATRYNGDTMVKAHDTAVALVRDLVDQLLDLNKEREQVSA